MCEREGEEDQSESGSGVDQTGDGTMEQTGKYINNQRDTQTTNRNRHTPHTQTCTHKDLGQVRGNLPNS